MGNSVKRSGEVEKLKAESPKLIKQDLPLS